jgi:hypothetical protein
MRQLCLGCLVEENIKCKHFACFYKNTYKF